MDVKQLRQELTFHPDQKLVILLSLSTDPVIRETMKYPEVYFMDVTYGCNRQGRNLFVNSGRKPTGRCYLSNVTLIPNGEFAYFL